MLVLKIFESAQNIEKKIKVTSLSTTQMSGIGKCSPQYFYCFVIFKKVEVPFNIDDILCF